MDKIYNDLEECVDEAMKKSSFHAVQGVDKDIGGPFGAAIIQEKDGKYIIIAVARNSVIRDKDATAHAEINAIRQASGILNKYDLSDCILVTTARSCPMCISAACWSRITKVYYALDYNYASSQGFKDKDILEYLNGNNSIISEINKQNEYAKMPFENWNNKEKKETY